MTASAPILDLHKQHNILTTSFGGLGPITRAKGESLDPVLEKIAGRVSEASNTAVTPGQVLQLWLRKKGIPCITYAPFHPVWYPVLIMNSAIGQPVRPRACWST